MYFIHSTISIQRYMPQSEESKSTALEYARPDALACQLPSLRPALRLQWASTLDLHPLDAAGSSAQHLLALPPREPLCATTAHGDRARLRLRRKVALGLSGHVRSGGMSTSLSICSINIFLLLYSGEDGWG